MSQATGTANFPRSGASGYVYDYIDSLPDLQGRTVVDVPCGDGRASDRFRRKGAEIVALDLFPEFMRAEGVTATFADMTERLPLPDGVADYVICQEGIEHVPDQLRLLTELNRVLKPGGVLLLSTPSISHLRARLSWLLFESDSWRRMPPTTLDSVNVTDASSGRVYFGHLFLVGVHRLSTLATIAGFTVAERRRTELGLGSVLLAVAFYPLLAVGSLVTAATYARKRRRQIPLSRGRTLWLEHLALNLSPVTLACKHLFWILRKDRSPTEQRAGLTGVWRGGTLAGAVGEPQQPPSPP